MNEPGPDADPGDITRLLDRVAEGDSRALHDLMPQVYQELRSIAARQMHGEAQGHSWQPTDLVNEVFVRLIGPRKIEWQNRAHFMATAAQCMRRCLVDRAREKRRQKRGGGARRVPLDQAVSIAGEAPIDILQLEEGLQALAAEDPRKATVVEAMFFGGLNSQEVAEVLGVSTRTVDRDWRYSRAWLLDWLSKDD